MDARILLLALRGRDVEVIDQLLRRAGHHCLACASPADLARQLLGGAGAVVVTEESLGDAAELARWLEAQPPWSDLPFILLSTKRVGRRPAEAQAVLGQLGNVVMLERPIHGETLASAVNSALRGRRRQYQARDQFHELQAAEERLTQLNSTLEARIDQRTAELSTANNQLMQEIAERERAQAALTQAQKMEAIGQLTGGIAHDFNNLLTVISGNLELIQRRTTEERTARLADYAFLAADRAAKLTHQLLAFSRTQKLALRSVDINALVRGMDDLLARTIGSRINIEMNLDGGEPWAMADANQLELAVLNLAINGRDAIRDSGSLRIESRTEAAREGMAPGRYCVISVSDTGSGIPRSVIDRVFDPFFTTKPMGKGTGLGLSQVYGIAQQSGGTVQIESKEGKGTRVEIWLPLASAATPPQGAELLSATLVDAKTEKVLVVDDDDAVRRFVVDGLEALGYRAVQAGNGADGLKQLSKERPDLVIVDYAMPGMNGVEVISAVRRLAPDTPVLLATGYADMQAVDRVLEPQYVLRKPFKIDDLDTAVRAALTR